MTTDLRPPRAVPPLPRPAPFPIPAPPAAEDPLSQSSWAQSLMMSVGMLGGLVFIMINPSPLFLFGGGIFVLAAVGGSVSMAISQRRRGRKRVVAARDEFADRLVVTRARFAERTRSEYDVAWQLHPDPSTLASLAGSRRLFERRRNDDDFLDVRIGHGTISSRHVPVMLTRGDVPLDPAAHLLARQFIDDAQYTPTMPTSVQLTASKLCVVDGDPDAGSAMLRALIMQAVTWHSPADLRLVVAAPADRADEWNWTRWLPHTVNAEAVVTERESLSRLLTPELLARESDGERNAQTSTTRTLPRSARPHLLVVSDSLVPDSDSAFGLLAQPGVTDITVVTLVRSRLDAPRWHDLRIHVDSGRRLTVESPSVPVHHERTRVGSVPENPMADALAPKQAEVAARRIARVSAKTAVVTARGDQHDDSLPALLGIDDIAAATRDDLWQRGDTRRLLTTMIGSTTDGAPVELDIKESAAGGIGPHGLIVGATGSGKSELLRTIVTGLALTHSPELLSFVLADFKGGAAFAGLSELPHVAGLITNLADDTVRVDRMHQALQGEIQRRQELLRRAGNLSTIVDYQRRAGSGEGEPMPYLLIIVDEFTELLAAQPEFAELFAGVGRLGRSLGIHLLLASQRLDEGRLRGLESHISYRIALRTFSSVDSRAVLGVPDAFHLPTEPGWAFLKSGTMVFQRFRAAHASAPARPRRRASAEVNSLLLTARPHPWCVSGAPSDAKSRMPVNPGEETGAAAGFADPVTGVPVDGATSEAVWQAAVRVLADDSRRTHQVWLPPLAEAIAMGTVLPQMTSTAERGLQLLDVPASSMVVPLGVVDLPRAQRYDLLQLDLSAERGNVVVLGAPQTGKTTLLRTLAMSIALTHTPDEARLYCLDFGGGLRDLALLPHTAAVAGRGEKELAERVIATLLAEVTRRELAFADCGHTSMAAARSSDDPYPDLLLLVDTLLDVRNEIPDLEAALTELAHRGLAVGVHVIVTAARPADVRAGLRDSLTSRLELRLADPADSLVDRPTARTLPANIAGRIAVAPGVVGQIALAAFIPPGASQLAISRDVAALAAEKWTKAAAPPVRILPKRVEAGDLPAPAHDLEPGVPIGVGEPDLAPMYLDLTGLDPHLLIVGESRSGKTNLLRLLLHGLHARVLPGQAVFHVVDYRRNLLDVAEDNVLAGYSGAAPAASHMVKGIAETLTARLPGPGLTAAELRSRSWWSGPEIFVVVDDYELVDSAAGNPLAPLIEFLPQARDIGLHLLLSRGSSGIARALVNPLVQRVRDFGGTTILLSGDPADGVVVNGIKPSRQPVGRGQLLHQRAAPSRVQLALVPTDDLGAEVSGMADMSNTASATPTTDTRTRTHAGE